jgi:hypothetical protein
MKLGLEQLRIKVQFMKNQSAYTHFSTAEGNGLSRDNQFIFILNYMYFSLSVRRLLTSCANVPKSIS